jgi:hypothetical protein
MNNTVINVLPSTVGPTLSAEQYAQIFLCMIGQHERHPEYLDNFGLGLEPITGSESSRVMVRLCKHCRCLYAETKPSTTGVFEHE